MSFMDDPLGQAVAPPFDIRILRLVASLNPRLNLFSNPKHRPLFKIFWWDFAVSTIVEL